MADNDRSLRDAFEDAQRKQKAVETSFDSNSSTYQENILAAIRLFEQCLNITHRLSLFSPNESLDDIASADLQYLALNYQIAELATRANDGDRRSTLKKAQRHYERFLKQLDNYEILSKDDSKLLEHYEESPNAFSTASTIDPAARRNAKIKRFKEEKALKQRLDYMRNNSAALQNDDSAYRELQLTSIAYYTHQTFASLESIAQEMHILSLAPPSPPSNQPQQPPDMRERSGAFADGFTERLDAPLDHRSAGLRGPLLDPQGKPLRPFTLTNGRQDVQRGVFRPGHSLPTMSIDEYLEEERRRGGIIEGGGPQSGMRPEPNEDDMEAADRETMKAREWDEFVEANPKGSGNTLNRG